MINFETMEIYLDDGSAAPIVNCLDVDGDECVPAACVAIVAGPWGPDDRFIAADIGQEVTMH